MTSVFNIISEVAYELPSSVIENFCSKLEALQADEEQNSVMGLINHFPQPHVQQKLNKLLKAWFSEKASESLTNLAWALRSASQMDEYWRQSQSIDLIWTGPSPHGSVFRRTDQALLDLIKKAHKDIIIVTFAAYKVPEIISSLVEASYRKVKINIILESSETSQGKIQYDGIDTLGKEIKDIANIYVWPINKRHHDEKGHCGTLHAKCAVADKKILLISSANLTEHALNLNMEMGIFIQGGKLPIHVHEHFYNLIGNGILVKLSK